MRVRRLTTGHGHVEHSVDNSRRLGGVVRVISRPLDDNHEIHEAEEAEEEDDLRDEFEEELNPVVFVGLVEALKDDTHGHLEDTEDQSELHFDGVHKHNLIRCHVPGRVETNWVDTVGLCGGEVLAHFGHLPAGVSEKVHADGGEIVVDNTTEDGEKAHQEEEVAAGRHSGDNRARSLWSYAEVEACSEKESAREDITEHDTEEEGERDVGKQTWVHLLVGGNLILVNDHLTDGSEFTIPKVGRDGQLRVDFTLNGVDIKAMLA